MAGVLYGVSVGPGDPELMTVKSVRILERCSVIAAPRTSGRMLAYSIAEKAVDMSRKTVIPLDMPMTHDNAVLSEAWDKAADTIAQYLDTGEDAAMLTLGDVSVYSTYAYIAERISAMGYECVMCAGVPSFCAAAAAAGIPLVTGDEPMTVLPSGYLDRDELAGYLAGRGTKVLMKGGRDTERIAELAGDARIWSAERCGLDGECIMRGVTSDGGYFTTIIVK